jgi:uncharacterized protein (DUF1501 family)
MEGRNMKQDKLISRRDLIASASTLAVAAAVMPKFMQAATEVKDEFIIVNGWVLKRSEAA